MQNAQGTVLEQYQAQPVKVMPASVAHDISAMLSNNEARFPEYPPVNPLNFPGYDVAVKTGTTNDYRDAWTVGYTPSVVIGTWAGNNDNSPMVKEIAGYIVAPMWHALMQTALNRYPKEYFGEPTALATTTSPALRGQYMITQPNNPFPVVHSLLYWVNKDNPQGPQPANPSRDPQYLYWEYPVQVWAAAQGIANASTTPSLLGTP